MIACTNESGVVLMFVESGAKEHAPLEMNGQKLTAHELTQEQVGALAALPAERAGTTFDGEVFGVVQPSAAAVKLRLEAAVQRHLDGAASERGYDNIFTAVTYAEEDAVPNFQVEGVAFRKWRSLVWAHCYVTLNDVQQGVREIPTEAELINELPKLGL